MSIDFPIISDEQITSALDEAKVTVRVIELLRQYRPEQRYKILRGSMRSQRGEGGSFPQKREERAVRKGLMEGTLR
jgi:hypothetical protein